MCVPQLGQLLRGPLEFPQSFQSDDSALERVCSSSDRNQVELVFLWGPLCLAAISSMVTASDDHYLDWTGV